MSCQASCLPCSAVTAWRALMTEGNLRPGEIVLVQGTGGVSLFCLQAVNLAFASCFGSLEDGSGCFSDCSSARMSGYCDVIERRQAQEGTGNGRGGMHRSHTPSNFTCWSCDQQSRQAWITGINYKTTPKWGKLAKKVCNVRLMIAVSSRPGYLSEMVGCRGPVRDQSWVPPCCGSRRQWHDQRVHPMSA